MDMGKIPFRSWGFRPAPDAATWPVTVRGLGHEAVQSRDYRWTPARHGDSGWVIQYTLAGQGSLAWSWPAGEAPAGQAHLEAGDLFVTAPGMAYEYAWRRPGSWEFYWIMVSGGWAGAALARLARGGPVLRLDRDARVVLRLADLLAAMGQAAGLDHCQAAGAAYSLLLDLETLRAAAASTDSTADQARAWLRQHWAQADGTALAAHFGYHPKYFITWFKARTGQTPERFLQAERLQQARLRLAATAAPVARIAGDLGFPDARYFSRVFRAATGLAPGQWRRRNPAGPRYDEVLGG